MTTNHDIQRRVVFHGAVVLLIGLLCGFPSVLEVSGQSGRMWQAAHSALLIMGVWLVATAAVLHLLVLEKREASGLVWSLLITAYSFMAAVIIQAITGVRSLGPDASPVNMAAFAANTVAVLGALLAASLTLVGAHNGLRAARAAMSAESTWKPIRR